MILGIDPGSRGAIAVIDGGLLIDVHDMPSVEVAVGKTKRTRVSAGLLADVLRRQGLTHAFVEQVGAMPGQGTSSMFAFGKSAGIVEGVLAGLGIPITLVTPQSWKKAMRLVADKDAARQRAVQLFPERAEWFRRVKDDGRAEAAMIALYGWQRSA